MNAGTRRPGGWRGFLILGALGWLGQAPAPATLRYDVTGRFGPDAAVTALSAPGAAFEFAFDVAQGVPVRPGPSEAFTTDASDLRYLLGGRVVPGATFAGFVGVPGQGGYERPDAFFSTGLSSDFTTFFTSFGGDFADVRPQDGPATRDFSFDGFFLPTMYDWRALTYPVGVPALFAGTFAAFQSTYADDAGAFGDTFDVRAAVTPVPEGSPLALVGVAAAAAGAVGGWRGGRRCPSPVRA